ncbi:L,D-transpeptidase catalytic domain [Sulfurivirga caldicuralii]|uniref:L,D-transpeptidase catalytic domain n=1 Tax=Sulfurivirga caldicuralii TaxID=364032 RepID=A0A1N6GM59_9GAMM|nr:L,D-transpeptidase family protein [Sulfurivirga caldicuralii]SIO08595.1 L,D-transpeptidase catalytic domain [Sulfurivirga caldicuralii]
MKAVWGLIIGLTLSLCTLSAPAFEDPEAHLIGILKALQSGDIDTARARAETLRSQFPNYPMGKVLSVELNARLAGDKVVLKKLHAWHRDTVRQILAEARLRWQYAEQAITPEQWVHNLILSPGQQPWWVVVDLSASRLYLFENHSGQLRLALDTYISKGAGGIGKARKGDQRTPVGLYRITEWRNGADLPPIYGDGALVLDYPNPWDRFVGRTGSGIWLHGTPPDLYARPPASSKGCVVLSNGALEALKDHLQQPQGTPVLLVESIDKLSAADPDTPTSLIERVKTASPSQALELVRYPGEQDMYYVAWVGHGGLHAQFWRHDPHNGVVLALEQRLPLSGEVKLAEKAAPTQIR